MLRKIGLCFWDHMREDVIHSSGYCILSLLVGLDLLFTGIVGFSQLLLTPAILLASTVLTLSGLLLLRTSLSLGKNSITILRKR